MTALLTADMCPSCRGIHGQPTDWPTCPEHEHWLYLLRRTDDGWTYACPARAPKCAHTHTQRERATMTATHEAAHSALAIRPEQELFTDKQRAALAQLGITDASNADLAVFMHYCQKTGLDPFSRQIYMIGRKMKDGSVRQTIQVGIDGYRVIAARAARDAGVVLSYGDTIWYDANGQRYEAWIFPTPPAAAAVTVYKDGKPFPAVVRFASFAAYERNGELTRQWAAMPDHMIAKCAEAQALRKAFPHDLVGISTDDENAHLANPRPNTARQVNKDSGYLPARKPAQDPETLRAAIRAQFDRLSIVDDDERDGWVARLLHEDTAALARITTADLADVLQALESCDDIGQLHTRSEDTP